MSPVRTPAACDIVPLHKDGRHVSTFSFKGFVASAFLVATLVTGSTQFARADEPATTAGSQPLTSPAAPGSHPTDNALRRSTAAPALAPRTYCRDQAAKMRLFGLARHKFLQRCRRARRKAMGR